MPIIEWKYSKPAKKVPGVYDNAIMNAFDRSRAEIIVQLTKG